MNASHSRPRTSNDYPFSEAQFKTAKYHPGYPDFFDSLLAAHVWGRHFFPWHNFGHHGIGLGLMTPAAVHYGWAPQLREPRQHVLGLAYQTHPERFVHGWPEPSRLPVAIWINPPTAVVPLSPALEAPMAPAESHELYYFAETVVSLPLTPSAGLLWNGFILHGPKPQVTAR